MCELEPDRHDYLNTMRENVAASTTIKTLIKPSLTDKINGREMSIKGIDYS